MGAIIKPSKKVKVKKSPMVNSSIMILYPPIPIIPVVARPNKKVEELVINAVAVRLLLYVLEQSLHAFLKNLIFLRLGIKTLDDPHTAQGFG